MRKRFSMLIALVMLMTSLIPSFSVNAAFSDVEDTNPYNKAIATLSSLNVINGYGDGTFLPNKEITRAEFTKMVVFMLGKDNLTTPITTFNDVSLDHWANAYIRTAYDLGIINGFDEVTFKPDAPVTYEQALKMLVCTLGYGQFAEATGGYPDGYRSQASSLKLTDLVTGVGYTDNAPRGIIAQIMYNALEVDMYEVINGALQNSKKNLLNDYLNVVGIEGTLVAVGDAQTSEASGTTVYPSQMAIKDRKTNQVVVIDYTQSTFTETQLTASLGRVVQVYYRQDGLSSDKFLIGFTSDAQKGSEVTINSVNIISFDGTSLKYYTADGTNTIKISSNPSVRYNGKPASVTEINCLDPNGSFFYGTARFVSDGSSNAFNMVEIYDYNVMVATRTVSSSDYILTDKYKASPSSEPNSISLKPGRDDFTITKNGSAVEPTDISANDVVLYATSLDGLYKTVKVSNKSVSGKIDSLNTTKQIITINGTDYNYSQYFVQYMNTEQRFPSVGDSVKVYTDDFGTLQWGTVTSAEKYYPYAYAITAESTGRSSYVQMFAPKSTTITSLTASTPYAVDTFTISEKVKLDGAKSSDTEIVTRLQGNAQFIRVGFNADNEITDVITVSGSPSTENIDASKLVNYAQRGTYYVTTNALRSGSATGTTVHSLKSSTPMFVIPSNLNNHKDFALKSAISSSSFSSGGNGIIESYDVNKSKYPAFIAVYGESFASGTPITADTNFSAVNEIIEEYDQTEGATYNSVSMYTTATELSTKRISDTQSTDPNNKTSYIEKGDMVLFGYDEDGHINNTKLCIDYSTQIKPNLDNDDYNWSGISGNGGITDGRKTMFYMYNVLQTLKDESKLYVSANSVTDTNYEVLNLTNSTKILRYDAQNEEFSPYAENTDTLLTLDNIIGSTDVGSLCSKIAVGIYDNPSVGQPTVEFIIIYE